MVDTHVSPKRTRNKLQGKLRRRTRNGNYSYRLTSSNGSRKEFTLQTRNYDEAVLKASELDSIWLAPTKEVALAQMNAMRGFSLPEQDASFDEAWAIYKTHPNRATPRTVEEQIGYRRTFREFASFASGIANGRVRRPATTIRAVTPELCEEFSSYLKSTSLAVNTHNRKMKRLRRIFECLRDYYNGDNPFRAKTLMRSVREEQGAVVHRQAFTMEQEEQLVSVLSDSDPRHKVKNKTEIRILYIIGRFTGQRLKDCVLLQWQNIDMSRQRIWVKLISGNLSDDAYGVISRRFFRTEFSPFLCILTKQYPIPYDRRIFFPFVNVFFPTAMTG